VESILFDRGSDEMKPTNVTDHRHYFVYPEDEEEGEGPRFDAYITKEGLTGVWCVHTDSVFPTDNYKTAKFIAAKMAQSHRELYPR
jgi:hypothetical protein